MVTLKSVCYWIIVPGSCRLSKKGFRCHGPGTRSIRFHTCRALVVMSLVSLVSRFVQNKCGDARVGCSRVCANNSLCCLSTFWRSFTFLSSNTRWQFDRKVRSRKLKKMLLCRYITRVPYRLVSSRRAVVLRVYTDRMDSDISNCFCGLQLCGGTCCYCSEFS